MKIVAPKPFMYKASKRAVLLLHGFTGNIIDVKMLGRYLHKYGYTCHAPIYKGHGEHPKELMKTGPADWWNTVLEAYDTLRLEGYEEISVVGVSLGGTFALKIASLYPIKSVVSICAPILERNITDLNNRVLYYAKRYYELQGMDVAKIESEIAELTKNPMESLASLQEFIISMRTNLPDIAAPTFVLQGKLDHSLYQESANIIFDTVKAEQKTIQWYEHSKHIITLGNEREQINQDILQFLDSLTWSR